MPKTISKLLHRKLLRSSNFKRILEDLHCLSQMEVLFIDDLGNERLRAPRQSRSKIRTLANRHPALHKILQQVRQHQLAHTPAPSCPVIEILSPIQVAEETLGYLVLSACREQQTDPAENRTFWTDLIRQGTSLKWREWEEAVAELPETTEEIRAAWRRMLSLQVTEAVRMMEDLQDPLKETTKLPPQISSACAYVQAHYPEPVRLRDLARAHQVSPEHFSRLFHQSTGLRFREYLAETRIRAACDQLNSTADLISEIAGRVGFSTLSRFNTAFRQHTGTTPRSYRKRGLRSP